MKKLLNFSFYKISVWTLFLMNPIFCIGQTDFFKMQRLPTEIINVQKTFSRDTIIYPFKSQNTIISLGINVKLSMNSQNSFVRIVLSDKNSNEYLIFEGGKSFATTATFSLTNYAEETAILNSVVPDLIKIEIYDATIDLNQILLSSLGIQKNINVSKNIQSEINFNKRNQDSIKVEKLNIYLKKKGFKWIAKETSFSKLTYEQKKKYFGNRLPNLNGFEFYSGGIFEIPRAASSPISTTLTSTIVESFDWRNRHGQNWLTSIKNQGSCGSCASFAATGTTEALVNLYYNQQINLDLAEQNAISCVNGDCSNGWFPSDIVSYYINMGVVDEACFPYQASSAVLCSTICPSPSERIKIGGMINFSNSIYPRTEESLKKMIIKYGPLNSGIYSWGHTMVLAGYYRDATDNQVVWIFKNSWGANWGDNGWGYLKVDINDIGWTYALLTPIQSLRYTDDDIKCVDLDGDGYYNWGIGPKPSTCPACVSDEEDGDDSNPNLGPMDENGICRQLTAPLYYPAITITSNATWNTKSALCSDLVISNGATLTITNQLTMPVYSTITIQGNSKLIVDGGKIIYANIIVNNGGELNLRNNATIELYKNDELSIETGAIFNNTYGEVKILDKY